MINIKVFTDTWRRINDFYKEIHAATPPQHSEPSMYGPPGTTAGKT